MSDDEIPVKIDRRLAALTLKFLADCRRTADELRNAVESGDAETLRRISHSLMGTGSSYGFDEMAALGEEIGRTARAGDVEALRTLAVRFERYLARVRLVYD
ncbi:MAG: Hpt domain-containing protein [Burkholderiales bacterium]|jgi:hypothetical protein